MQESDTGNISPAERTARLFGLDVFKLENQLIHEGRGVVIATSDSSRKIQLVAIEPFAKSRVGPGYDAMNHMQPGDLYNPPARTISQSLIVSQDSDGIGACVRLLKARYFDETMGSFIPELTVGEEQFKQREGDIARYLGLNKNDRSQLRFLDDSETLYIVKEGEEVAGVAPEDANKELEKLVNQQSQ